MFEEGLILLNCTETLEQLRIYTDYGGKMSNKKGEGNKDDLADSACLAIQAMKANRWYV